MLTFDYFMKDFKKYYIINATPEEVYLALTNELTLTLWTGARAEMSAVVGTDFSLWDDSILGKNLAFEENRSIVQQWYFGEQEEDSIVTIKLHAHKRGTSVELHHTNIPKEDYENITGGWNEDYFGSLIDFYTEPPVRPTK